MIDNKTPHRQYPLPDTENLLSEDVTRIGQAISSIDADVHATAVARGTLSSNIEEARQAVSNEAQAAQSTANSAVQAANAAQSTANSAVQAANAAQSTADNAVQAANAAQSTADDALPKRGGIVTGHVTIRYDHNWVGIGLDKTGSSPGGSFVDALLNGIVHASQQIRFHDDGSASYVLQLTPPGDVGQERREDTFRVEMSGLWHKSYGQLHDFFVKKTDNNSRFHHEEYPNHFNGAEVWWDKQTGLKIVLMRLKEVPYYSPLMDNGKFRLPEIFTGIWYPFISTKNHYSSNNPYAIAVGGHAVEAGGYSNVNQTVILAIGWSNQ